MERPEASHRRIEFPRDRLIIEIKFPDDVAAMLTTQAPRSGTVHGSGFYFLFAKIPELISLNFNQCLATIHTFRMMGKHVLVIISATGFEIKYSVVNEKRFIAMTINLNENMTHRPDQLQEIALKTLFGTYDHDKQISIIRDLMDIAKIDSIIRNHQPVMICGVDMTAPKDETPEQLTIRTYRNQSDEWIYQFLHRSFIVVEKDYLNSCFELFQQIVKLSKGAAHIELRGDERCTGLYACDQMEYGSSYDHENDRHDWCQSIFTSDIENCVIFSTVGCPRGYLWKIAFDDLFMSFKNHGESVGVILFLLGFFDYDEAKISDVILRMKEHFFPHLDGGELRAACYAMSLYGGDKTDPTVMTKLFNMFQGLTVTRVC